MELQQNQRQYRVLWLPPPKQFRTERDSGYAEKVKDVQKGITGTSLRI